MEDNIVIHWFRQDLRCCDNPSLTFTSERGTVLPIYIADDNEDYPQGSASKVWLHHSLKALNHKLNHHLNFYQGDALDILCDLIKRHSVKLVCWNRCYEPWQIKRDASIKKKLMQKGIRVKSFNGFLLWEPWEVLKQDDSPYKVFTPFYKKAYLYCKKPRLPENVKLNKLMGDQNHAVTLDQLNLLPKHNWHKKIILGQYVGEDLTIERLKDFLSLQLDQYEDRRDFPAENITSRLSTALHFGEISPNMILQSVSAQEPNSSQEKFLRQLVWREFSYHQLYYFNDLPIKSWKSKFDALPWENNLELFKAWKIGQTGIPIIDAAMRELWQTGIMHNRLRMVCASFLVKNCFVDWRLGSKWFWNCLLDADLANNSAGWQWVAGTGADASPYHRIFNPVRQSMRFDPEGIYIRKYIPEIAGLPTKYLFEPWSAPKDILEENNVSLGQTYPYPIVDLAHTRKKALLYYQALKN
ncbi:MAG: deoxyribodipyrimidine photo-lyase [Francisellaceae bacterium]|jgi:deoxyribodipyrimidine photo-lyase